MEHIAERIEDVNGVFIQMEDEIGSISAMIGAAWAGAKAMTATSGPGFSLMVEGIGYALMTETPLVIVNVQRQGPATGQATRPAQGDVMQARWGAHGDYRLIGLAPWSVQEMFDLTIRAFNLSEMFRVPVILLADEVVGHLKESISIKPEYEVFSRNIGTAQEPVFGTVEEDGVPAMPVFGSGSKLLVTGSTHNDFGFRKVADPNVQERLTKRLCMKIDNHRKEIITTESYLTEDCQLLVVGYGITGRSSYSAVLKAREAGLKVGLFRPITIWPFPYEELKAAAAKAEKVLVCEMNQGQILEIVRGALSEKVFGLTKTRGEPIFPEEIYLKIRESYESKSS